MTRVVIDLREAKKRLGGKEIRPTPTVARLALAAEMVAALERGEVNRAGLCELAHEQRRQTSHRAAPPRVERLAFPIAPWSAVSPGRAADQRRRGCDYRYPRGFALCTCPVPQPRQPMPSTKGASPWAALVLAGFVLLVLWALMSSGAAPLRSAPPSTLAAGFVLLAFLGTFAMLAMDLVGRLAAVVIGATVLLALGSLLGIYRPPDALRYVWSKLDTLVLLGGISAVTVVLAQAGFFAHLACQVVRRFGQNRRTLLLLLCLLTYGLSLFVNNLATILVIIPLSLIIADALDVDPVTLVLAEVIASNLGGASTMIGDFPNMLIATETGLPFHEFLIHLAPITMLELGVVLVFLTPAVPAGVSRRRRQRALVRQLGAVPYDRDVASRGQAILGAMVVGFAVCGELGVSPAVVAALGAAAAFLLGGVSPRVMVRRMCWEDVAFFACLFVMVGAVAASGILDGVGRSVGALWQASPAWGAIALAWGAALLTCVFNAGPTTALLASVLMTSVNPFGASDAVWWALSLGVCAGSSATLTGATAGPVAASLLEERGISLTFNRFARTGMPVMLAFLIVSSCYLAIVAR